MLVVTRRARALNKGGIDTREQLSQILLRENPPETYAGTINRGGIKEKSHNISHDKVSQVDTQLINTFQASSGIKRLLHNFCSLVLR